MPKPVTKKAAPEPAPREAPAVLPNDSSMKWTRDLFALFGREKMVDQQVGQDALYVAVKTSPADRAVLLGVLRTLLGK